MTPSRAVVGFEPIGRSTPAALIGYGLPILEGMGRILDVKTTVEIQDGLFERARQHARRSGRPLRSLIEEGLRLALQAESRAGRYRLPDRSVGKPGAANPLESLSWQDLRAEIYGGR